MGSIDSAVSLLLAVTDLAAVRAVTKAINANLPKNGPLGTSRPTYAQLTPRPRPHYTPTLQPRPAPREVVHPTPNFGIGLTTYNRSGYANPCCEKLASSQPVDAWQMEEPRQTLSAGPFDAPWKHLPPVSHPESQMKVNLVRPQVDLITKGMLLDLFA